MFESPKRISLVSVLVQTVSKLGTFEPVSKKYEVREWFKPYQNQIHLNTSRAVFDTSTSVQTALKLGRFDPHLVLCFKQRMVQTY